MTAWAAAWGGRLYYIGRTDHGRPMWAVYAPDGRMAAGPFYHRETAQAVAAEYNAK